MRSLGVIAVALLAACSSLPDAGSTTTEQVTTSSTSRPATTTTAVPPPGSGCPLGEPLADRGVVRSIQQPDSDTGIVGLVTWSVDGECERFDVEFETAEGAPATTPPSVLVEFLEGRQILRVTVGVEATVITDQLVETALVDRVFVVRSLEGGLYLDFHLSGPARARATVSASPGMLNLELEPGSEPLTGQALVTDRVVVTSPRDGADVDPLLDIRGYARTFEASVTAIATIDGEVVAQTVATAADWAETWGEFRMPLEVTTGEISLFVGEQSPEDGSLQGVTLSLTAG